MPLLDSRSKSQARKVTPPGPVYMSNEQFADYLADLRNTRVSRPTGARHQPSRGRRESDRGLTTTSEATTIQGQSGAPPMNETLPSISPLHRRAQSSFSTYTSVNSRVGRPLVQQPYPEVREQSEVPARPLKPSEVVPSATYIERGLRWMEKEEAVALRDAMEDMDLKEEEAQLHTAAQDEASELVWQHQHPEAIGPPGTPYRYKEHLRKNSYAHARTQSVGRYGGIGMVTGLARDIPRSVSGSSSGSEGILSPRSRVSSGASGIWALDQTASSKPVRLSLDSPRDLSGPKIAQKPYGSIRRSGILGGGSRRKSSARRNISGEAAGTFTGDQIWEEPEREGSDRGRKMDARDMPAPLRLNPRNPLNRVQFAQGVAPRSSSTPSESVKKLSNVEIHRNPPSQSRNPIYTANPVQRSQTPTHSSAQNQQAAEQATRESLEIRSDDIRQATSMRLKDRSPKLPTPTAVSDKPGRPIVSFDSEWEPKEADFKPGERRQPQFERASDGQKWILPARSHSTNVSSPVPTIQLPDAPAIQVNAEPSFPIPTIDLPDSTPSVPTISLPDTPKISISTSVAPNIDEAGSTSKATRPLPVPKSSSSHQRTRNHNTGTASKGHWSRAVGNRATASCHQCQLPIEGRVVSLRGVSERFHPQCFICYTCGTGLEALEISPEPEDNRNARLDRIRRRNRGEHIDEVEGQTIAEDGDERLRFYCHLDWHEHFAPRCKHCTTPIIGEGIVALNHHWHYGHFFCAECGDPFEQGMTHIEKDGYAWCLSCQTKRTERQAPKCKQCRKPVIGRGIQAMGGEYHDECFRCATCNGGFEDGQIFTKEVGNEMIQVLCTGCMERELKA